MKRNNYLNIFIIIILILLNSNRLFAEIIILSSCDNQKDGFLKNEYVLNLDNSIMTRNFVYNQKTFKKYRITDLSVKKKILCLNLFIKMVIKF